MCLTISDGTKIFFAETNYIYGYARNITVSCDSVFFAIDFDFGETWAYRVNFTGGFPSSAHRISSMSVGPHQESSISGDDWICATSSGKTLVLWEIATGRIHRVIKYPQKITAQAIDESTGRVWICVQKQVILLDLNGCVMGLADTESSLTAITTVEGELSAVAGCEDGSLVGFRGAAVEIVPIKSDHKSRIVRILLSKTFVCVDKDGVVSEFLPPWIDRQSLEEPKPPLTVFASCSVCTNPSASLCRFCGKPVCEQCMPEHVKGPYCKHCIAFM